MWGVRVCQGVAVMLAAQGRSLVGRIAAGGGAAGARLSGRHCWPCHRLPVFTLALPAQAQRALQAMETKVNDELSRVRRAGPDTWLGQASGQAPLCLEAPPHQAGLRRVGGDGAASDDTTQDF